MAASPTLDEVFSLLVRTPRVIQALVGDLSPGWLSVPDAPGGWTAWDVVGHLISAEMNNWIPRVELILREGASRPFDDFDRFAHVEREAGVALAALVTRFGDLRAGSLARLRELLPDDSSLERRGLHPQFGEVTLGNLLATWTVHDLDHTAQIFSALAGSRDAAVGPWKAFLGILQRRGAASA